MVDSNFGPLPSHFISVGGELPLSNRGQLKLLRAVTARGAQFRTTVRGYSMAPFIRDRDVLTIAPLNGVTPRIGEVVAFVVPDSGQLAIHRVLMRAGDAWLIGGDNCSETDGLISRENILGRVTRVERRGSTVHFGFGAEALLVAWLQRVHMLRPSVRVVQWLKRRLSVRSRLSGTGD